jgi:hypothetical protein
MLPRRSLPLMLIGLLLAAAGGAFAQGEGPATLGNPASPGAPAVPAALPGTGFTYQGELQDGGGPVTGNCDFEFRLYDALTLGAQVGSTQTLLNLPLDEGRFTARLNTSGQFGPRAFDGSARWLDISVRCPAGVGGFTPLSPRQPLLPAPLAFALPGLRTEYSGLSSPNVIGGHISNTVGVGVVGAVIGGGGQGAYPNSVGVDYGTVGGGAGNSVAGDYATVGGGYDNTAGGDYATVSGGVGNSASDWFATAGGGDNNVAFGWWAAIGGGQDNFAFSDHTTIAGGRSNSASGNFATVGGGSNNAAGEFAAVGGGQGNEATGGAATIPGGSLNVASGDYSFAAGRRAHAVHAGAFVWASGSTTPISSTTDYQFLVRASGGVTMYTNAAATAGAALFPGASSWTIISDRNAKANFAPVDGVAILNTLAGIPIETWNYNAQDEAIRHMGPMAQDFYLAFGLGETPTGISTVDADGVALAAIQGLYTVVQEKETRIAALEATVAALQQGRALAANTGQLASVLIVGLLAGAGIGAGAFALGRRQRR